MVPIDWSPVNVQPAATDRAYSVLRGAKGDPSSNWMWAGTWPSTSPGDASSRGSRSTVLPQSSAGIDSASGGRHSHARHVIYLPPYTQSPLLAVDGAEVLRVGRGDGSCVPVINVGLLDPTSAVTRAQPTSAAISPNAMLPWTRWNARSRSSFENLRSAQRLTVTVMPHWVARR